MAKNYIVPNVYIEDKQSTAVQLSNTSADSVVFAGDFKKGFIGKPVLISSPTIFEKVLGDDVKQPSIEDYLGGYYLSTLTSNFYVSRAFHFSQGETNHKSAYFSWTRATEEPTYKISAGQKLGVNENNITECYICNKGIQVGISEATPTDQYDGWKNVIDVAVKPITGFIGKQIYHVTDDNTYWIASLKTATPESYQLVQVFPVKLLNAGIDSYNKTYYTITGESSASFTDVELNKIQTYTDPTFIFKQNYKVKKVFKIEKSSTFEFYVHLEDGEKIESIQSTSVFYFNGIAVENGVNNTTVTVLSTSSLKIVVANSSKLSIKKGDTFQLNGIVESTANKNDMYLSYQVDEDSDGEVQQNIKCSVNGVALTSIYDPYADNIQIPSTTTNGCVVVAKTVGSWGNDLHVMLLGAEYWNSDENLYSWLYPNMELQSHELIVVVMDDNDTVLEKFLTSVDTEALNTQKQKYFIDDVVENSEYITIKYKVGEYHEVESGEINNVYIGDAATITEDKIAVTGSATDKTQSFKYKVEMTGDTTATVYVNDVEYVILTQETPNTTNKFLHNGFTFILSVTANVDWVTGNYFQWHFYGETDASGIRQVFQLVDGVDGTVDSTDIATAYNVFVTPEIEGLLPLGGTSFTTANMQEIAQSVVANVISKKINMFGLFNVPFDVINDSTDKAQSIADWSNQGGYFIPTSNEKYVVYDTYFNMLVKGKKVVLPKSFLMVANHLNTFDKVGRQQAVAGKKYGLIGGMQSIVWYPKEDELEKLILASINPTTFIIRSGFNNWGQRTFIKRAVVEKDAHVILTKIKIQSVCQTMLKEFQFDSINEVTVSNMIGLLKTYLGFQVKQGALEEFTVNRIADPTPNTVRLGIKFRVPETLEFIVIEFEPITR